jgi:4-carboxymuconolactone decarboxylase
MDTYYQPQDLAKFEEIGKEAPELARKFFDYYNAVFAEGELTEREKAEMTEAVHVVAAIRGGASLVHGVQMRNIAHKLSM